MWTFAFVIAPTHYDARGALPDASGPAAVFARQKRLLVWLRDQLGAFDIPAFGPHAGDAGWSLTVNAEGGLVFILLDPESDGGRFLARVKHIGAAEVEAEDTAFAVESILSASPAVRRVEAA
jgi:hypothetical protein